MYNDIKRGIGHYQKTTLHAKSVCEKVAFLFDHIAKTIQESERAYAEKDFVKGAEGSIKAMEFATGLCNILLPETDQQRDMMIDSGQDWQIYFTDLINTFGRLTISHNEVLLEKTVKSLNDMANLWRSQARMDAEKTSPIDVSNHETTSITL
jgi:flagellin-specific chaperone FliS